MGACFTRPSAGNMWVKRGADLVQSLRLWKPNEDQEGRNRQRGGNGRAWRKAGCLAEKGRKNAQKANRRSNGHDSVATSSRLTPSEVHQPAGGLPSLGWTAGHGHQTSAAGSALRRMEGTASRRREEEPHFFRSRAPRSRGLRAGDNGVSAAVTPAAPPGSAGHG